MNKEPVKERRINFTISEGEPFFSHELSVNFNPTQFILDYKCITPRVDARSNDGSTVLSLKHNVVMMEPYHAKQMLDVLTNVIGKYEKRFGKIQKPNALVKLEKEVKKKSKPNAKKTKTEEDIVGSFPRYLG